MLTITGKYNIARLFNDNTEDGSQAQFLSFCNQWWLAGETIRGMPDAHQGVGVSIGTVCTLRNRRVSAGFVGVDISCGMRVVKLWERALDRARLDVAIRSLIPLGFNVHRDREELRGLRNLTCYNSVNIERAERSLGTLGSGNHFCEVNRDEEGSLYLVIHTGSRNIGAQVADHHQKLASFGDHSVLQKATLIERLKREGRQSEIQAALEDFVINQSEDDLPFLEGALFDNYVNDMLIMADYARVNRFTIAHRILSAMNLHADFEADSEFETVHNYIDFSGSDPILRKGAVSAQLGEKLLIPMNREDGSLLCEGKGNADWLNSAPHGAGRQLSRSAANKTLHIEDSQRRMADADIYSTSVNEATLDESKEAYKPTEEIIACIEPTVTVLHHLKTIYNLKDDTKKVKRGKR